MELDALSNDELVALMVALIIACTDETKRRLNAPHKIAEPLRIPGYDPNEPADGKPVVRAFAQGENKKILSDFIKSHLNMPAKEIQSELRKQGILFGIQTIYNLKYRIKKESDPSIIKGKVWKRNPLAKPDYKD